MFMGQTYQGSSFFELLRTDHPTLLSDFGNVSPGMMKIPHGTTVLALAYQEGALMAGDRLATAGNEVAKRDIEKVYNGDDHCLIAIAGAVGPAIETVRVFQTELEHYQKLEGQNLTFEGKANRLSYLIRQNLPAAMQGFVVMPLFAGFDLEKDRGRIYGFDVTGGRYAEKDYYATGSGGREARSSLKKNVQMKGFSRLEAIDAAIEALMDAADEDTATAGFDLARKIYPTCKLVKRSGVETVPDDEILASRERVLDKRRAA